ncbi:ferroxidase fet3, partial [Coemansia sp. RSA 2702]
GKPMLRDTINVLPFEYVKLRFCGSEPAIMYTHCHVAAHQAAGLAVTFVVAPDVMQRTQTIPEELTQMCLRQGLKASGNAIGNHGLDFTGLSPIPLTWNITYVQVNRDGYLAYRAIGVDNALPIPPVYVDQGDTLVLTVFNSLDVPVTIHAHGLLQKGTAHMDGAAQISQCGIPPRESFTYRILADKSGTYWLHAHDKALVADGLRAPFIVHDAKCPYEYDEDVLIYLEDWYQSASADTIEGVTKPDSGGPRSPIYTYGLINGYNGNDTEPIKFVPGKRYRIRVLSMSTTEWWKFSISGHKLKVIEADGVLSTPHMVDGLDVAPGQRYSAIVTAHNSDEFNFIYNCTLYSDFMPLAKGVNPRYYTGVIEYRAGAPTKQHVIGDDSQLTWDDDTKMSALNGPAELPVDRQILLSARGFNTADNRSLRVLGTLPYADQQVPTLFTAMTTGNLAMDPRVYSPQAQVSVIPHMQNVEVMIKNPQGQPHPFHFHATQVQVIERGPLLPNELEPSTTGFNVTVPDVSKISIRRSQGKPMLRDTVNVPSYEYVKLRFSGAEPAIIYTHCHIAAHMAAGLAVTFVVAPDVMQRTQIIPEELTQMCLRQGLKASGNAVGNQGLNFTGLPPVPVKAPLPSA